MFTDEELIEMGKRAVTITNHATFGLHNPDKQVAGGLVGFVFHTLLEQEKEKRKP